MRSTAQVQFFAVAALVSGLHKKDRPVQGEGFLVGRRKR